MNIQNRNLGLQPDVPVSFFQQHLRHHSLKSVGISFQFFATYLFSRYNFLIK